MRRGVGMPCKSESKTLFIPGFDMLWGKCNKHIRLRMRMFRDRQSNKIVHRTGKEAQFFGRGCRITGGVQIVFGGVIASHYIRKQDSDNDVSSIPYTGERTPCIIFEYG
jgi:hypothetical protein